MEALGGKPQVWGTMAGLFHALRMPVSIHFLQQLPLFGDLPQVTLEHLAEQAQLREFAKRQVVLQKGAQGMALHFLLSGRLQGLDFTLDAREVGLYFVHPGDYFGEVALLDGQGQPEFVTALARAQVASIDEALIRPLLFSVPALAQALCARLAGRLRAVSAQRRILGLSTPLQRVCAQLQLLCQPQPEGWLGISNAPTHQELAIMVNLTRESVSRVFQLLQGRGIVERQGNDLRLDQPQLLTSLAEGEELG